MLLLEGMMMYVSNLLVASIPHPQYADSDNVLLGFEHH